MWSDINHSSLLHSQGGSSGGGASFYVPHSLAGDTSLLPPPEGPPLPSEARASQLLRRYQRECESLRAQVAALQLREAHLAQQLAAAAACEQQHRERQHQQQQQRSGCAPAAPPAEVSRLQLRVRELEGRLAACEECARRPPPPPAAPSEASATHALLCRCLSLTGYLVKAANAAQHCQPAAHADGRCRRPLRECRRRCLAAARRGNTEGAAEAEARGHRVASSELAAAALEELQYCETVLVRLCAAWEAAEDECTDTEAPAAAEIQEARVDSESHSQQRHPEGEDEDVGEERQQAGAACASAGSDGSAASAPDEDPPGSDGETPACGPPQPSPSPATTVTAGDAFADVTNAPRGKRRPHCADTDASVPPALDDTDAAADGAATAAAAPPPQRRHRRPLSIETEVEDCNVQ